MKQLRTVVFLVLVLSTGLHAQTINECVGVGLPSEQANLVCGNLNKSGDSTLGAIVLKSTGAIESDATNLGLDAASGANTACNTTCAVADGACLFGFDAGTTALVDCASALADTCICAEAVS